MMKINILRKLAEAGFLLLLIFTSGEIKAQDGWYFLSNIQVGGGNYIFDSYSRTISVYGGLRYQKENFGITASIPLVSSDNSSGSQSNGMMFTSGNYSQTNSNPMQNVMNIGLGDLYIYMDHKIITDYESDVDLFINAQVKVPTAATRMNFGTGKFDLGSSVTFRKSLNTFIAIADFGYLNIGDPDSITYKNPFTYGIGFGKFFNFGKYSLLLYYSGYTKIIESYDLPKQLSLGINYIASDSVIFSFISSKGFGNTSPDFTFSGGIRIKL